MAPRKRPQLDRVEVILQNLIDRSSPNYDRDHQKQFREDLEVIRESKRKSDIALWEEGDAFARIDAVKLYIQAGFGGMRPFVENGLHRSKAWVDVLIKFASTYSRAQVEAYGRKKLELGTQYAGLTRTPGDNASIESLLLKVPADGEGERLSEIPFPKATEPELQLAIQHQRNLAAARRDASISVEHRAVVDLYAELVRDELEKRGREGQGGVRVRHAPDGDPEKAMADISVPLSELPAILKRLAKGR